jgi:eukaryotic-like serine/threonine-protein kinase
MDSSGGRRPQYGSIAEGGTVSTGGLGTESTAMVDAGELLPDTMVGEYKILGPLGAGGMGRVYSAEHPVIAKKAAIKVLHPELSVNREAVDRFVQEARSVNQIGHPNIVDIFSFGRLPDGRNYFVMEWLRGESLRDRIKRQRLSLPDALVILETITLPLEAAHEKGIVHRDLKPDNVFLVDVRDDRPQVKLLDFGIAKLMGAQGMQRTQTGNMLGTPAYISPEQARAEGVDHRTDIYALAAMAFEMFTGEMVFAASNAADMIAQHLYQTPRSAHALDRNVPPALDALLVRMLAKAASDRPTLAEVRNEMRGIRLMGGVSTPAHGVPRVHTPAHGVYATPSHMMPYGTPAPQITPSAYRTPPSSLTHMTPAHGQPTPAPPASTLQAAAPRRSRVPMILVSLLLLGGMATAAFIFVSSRGSTKPTPAVEQPSAGTVEMKAAESTPTEPQPAEARAAEPIEAKPTEPVETKPDETKPVETTTVETKPVQTVDKKPADSKRPSRHDRKRPTKPTQGSGSATKPGQGSGSATKPAQGSGTKPFDPDAPM